MDEMYLVVRKVSDILPNYLMSTDIDSEWWSDIKEDAWKYTSTVAFNDADRLGGKVFLRTKVREIEVTREDFGFE